MITEPTDPTRLGRWRLMLEIVSSILVIGVCAAMILVMLSERRTPERPPSAAPTARRAPLSPPRDPVPLDGAATKGSPMAKVAIIQYSEFECPFCATFFRETLPALEKTYVASGRVLLAFRHLPLERIHPSAVDAAAAAECANLQGKFWEMHDALFQDPRQLDRGSIQKRARAIGLGERSFTDCLDGQSRDTIRADIAAARDLGISGTPTFLIGFLQSDRRVKITHRIPGAQPFRRFQEVLDNLLQSALASSR